MSCVFKPPGSGGSNPPSSPLARQLRAAANFLAPPPPRSCDAEPPSPTSQALIGIRNDLAELGDSLRSSFAMITSTIWSSRGGDFSVRGGDVSVRGGGGSGDVAVGLTEEVVRFVEQIALRPQYWTNFPISLEDDFAMSDAQIEHASVIEDLVPTIKELIASLHDQISDAQFWMVYFILLLPRLDKHDFNILSTPPLIEKRNALVEKLRNKRDTRPENLASNTLESSHEGSNVKEKRKKNISPKENEVTEIIESVTASEIEEEEEEQVVSVSEYENDYNDHSRRVSVSFQKPPARIPSPSGSSDWVQLNGPVKARKSPSPDKDSDAESSDWFKVGDSD